MRIIGIDVGPAKGGHIESDLTQRIVEAFFSTGNYKTPTGVSVRPYSGCPHWTISRRMLGLPRIGRYDCATGLPFSLIVRDDDPPKAGQNIVEVHPALALWLWFRDVRPKNSSWIYKAEKTTREEIWNLLKGKFGSVFPKNLRFAGEIPSDDELDAVTAWLFARCWLRRQHVSLMGGAQAGALLLPVDDVLQGDFPCFRANELRRRQRV